jgi:hypothetical protein
MITIKSTQSPNKIDGSPFDDFGFNYLWRLRGLGKYVPAFSGMCVLKNGFAKYCRAGGFNGVESRIIETLRNTEDSFNLPSGSLDAELIALTTGTFDETLSSEQFFHKKNKAFRLAGLFRDLKAKGKKPVGGHSEFFNMPEKTAKAKFANAQRKNCQKIGLETVQWKRATGIHGCPVPLENPEEIGYAL